jgi:hypothetical protein
MANALYMPNILDTYNQGVDRGKQNRLADLAGQAYGATGEQRNALVGQAVGVDPQQGFALAGQLHQQEATEQSAKDAQLKKLGGAARFMLQAIKSGNPQQVQGAYQAVRPFLASASGKEPPPQWDPAMEPALYQVIAQTGGLPQDQGVVVSPGGALVNKATGESMFRNPANLQYQQVPMGAGKAAGVFDPSTGQLRPAMGAAPSAGDPMDALIAEANRRVQAGENPDQVEAELRQQAAQMGMQPQAPGGNQLQTTQAIAPTAPAQFGIGTPRPPGGGSFTQLSPEEVKALGLPEGTVAQRGSNGKVDVISKPTYIANTASAPGNPSLTGEAYLASIPDKGTADIVRAIADGRKSYPTASALKDPYWQTVVKAVQAYDPGADETDFNTRRATRRNFTSGEASRNMRALEQVAEHLDHLNDVKDEVAGVSFPVIGRALNAASNAYAEHSGDKGIVAWDTAAQAVAAETRKLFAGSGGGTLEELRAYLSQLSPNNSMEQKNAAIKGLASLVNSRVKILQGQYAQGMGKSEDPFHAVGLNASDILAKLSGEPNQFATTTGVPSSTTQPQPSVAPAASGTYQVGQIINVNGRQYRVTGGDPNDPDVEPVQ